MLQDSPDLFDELVNDMLIANLGGNMLHHRAADECQFALFPFGFARLTKQQVQVDGQHLRQVVMRLLRGKRLMLILAPGNRQQPQFTERFDDDCVGMGALQGKGRQ